MARQRAAAEKKSPEVVTSESIISELEEFDQREEDSTYMIDTWAHRTESESFVRAFAWARKRKNELKGCLIYADAHELDFETSSEPVVQRD